MRKMQEEFNNSFIPCITPTPALTTSLCMTLNVSLSHTPECPLCPRGFFQVVMLSHLTLKSYQKDPRVSSHGDGV